MTAINNKTIDSFSSPGGVIVVPWGMGRKYFFEKFFMRYPDQGRGGGPVSGFRRLAYIISNKHAHIT